MANMRIIADNAFDRAATVTANITVPSLPVTNMQTDYKSEVWRTTGTGTVILTVTFNNAEIVSGIVMAFSNLSPAATVFTRFYNEAADTTIAFQTPSTSFAPATNLNGISWGAGPIGANAYNVGGGVYATQWMAPQTCKKVSIVIQDATNPAGYLEASRLIIGNYWSPTYTAEAGASLGVIDTSKNERTDAGDLRTDRGTIHKTLSLDLNYLTNTDRNAFFSVMRNGINKPMFVTLVPESGDDTAGEQIYSVYGKMSRSSALKYQLLNMTSTSLEIEEI